MAIHAREQEVLARPYRHTLVLVGVLLVLAKSSAIAPFIYTLF
jgi:hypothetical protein